MSSIYLKKDHAGNKAGTIISVPFGVGKSLIAKGVGEYPTEEQLDQYTASSSDEPKPEAKFASRGPGAKGTEAKGMEPDSTSPQPMKPDFPPTPAPSGPTTHSHEKKK